MEELNWLGVAGFVIISLLVGGFIGFNVAPSEKIGLTDIQVRTKIDAAVNKALELQSIEIENLLEIIEESKNKIVETKSDTDTIKIGYLVDELYLSELFGDVYSDRELNLFDGEIEFDGKDYDAEETLILKDIKLLANEKDFEGNVYMTLLKGAIEYKFEFESDLDVSDIDDDETLKFSFLGKEVEIFDWDPDNEITFTQGKIHELYEDEIVTIDGKEVKLEMVLSNSIYVSVDGEGEKITEGSTKKIQGLEIKAKEVLYDSRSDRKSMAILVIGDEVEYEISDGEEYEDDSIWEWKITSNSIGLVLTEDFTEIDEDEDFPALGIKEQVCLPNDYVCVRFNGMSEEDTEEYEFELDGDFVKIKGNFQSGTKDYDEVYMYTNGSIYEDDDLESYIGEEIELRNTEIVLKKVGEWITIEDFKVHINLTSSEANGIDISSKDEDYLTDYGILISNPEDSATDKEFEISVPEEKVEGSISLI